MTRRRGRLAIVLHTHMPYVLGFGTWPFGEGAAGDDDVAREVERASGDYRVALERLPADPIAALRPHAA